MLSLRHYRATTGLASVSAAIFFTPPATLGLDAASRAGTSGLGSAAAPEVRWSNTYGVRRDYDHGGITWTSDGQIMVAARSGTLGGERLRLAKIDGSGNLVWARDYGERGRSTGHDVIENSAGNYVISAEDVYPFGNLWLLETNSAGDKLWESIHSGGGAYNWGWEIQEHSSGGYVTTGRSGVSASGYRAWTLRTDAAGSRQWSSGREWGHGYGLAETTSGGIVVAADHESSRGNYSFWVFGLDADGRNEWEYLGPASQGMAYDVIVADGGDIYALGHTNTRGAGDYDLLLVRLDAAGNEVWARTYGGEGAERGGAMAQLEDGSLVLVGETASYGAGDADLWVVAVDAAGEMLWDFTLGGAARDYGSRVEVDDEGGLVIFGGTDSFGSGSQDWWLIRTEPVLDCDAPLLARVDEPRSLYVSDTGTGAWTLESCEDHGFDFGIETECGWLAVDPPSGNVPAGSSVELALNYSAVGLVPGDYSCPVTIAYDDSGSIETTVDLEVVSPFSVAIVESPTSVQQGSALRWRFDIANVTDDTRDVEAWFDAYVIGGKPYNRNPVDGPYRGSLTPNFVLQTRNALRVPPATPIGGAYTLCTRVGVAPDQVWAEDCFEFSVVP